ncbi:hypothetical protein [Salinibaculum rarum]|jgi:hypothetical protein|uniref:hypothetical protein n=1 Tax=Salinibaculum rarum TaxID=3058903 RepID=UPI00265F0F39|nr:hypothetical protein [Salinibaculum sp. KK48]
MTGNGVTASDAPDDDDDSESSDEGYVHQPRSSPPTQARPTDGNFGWHGWLLVGVIVFAFLVVPIALLYLPEAQSLVRSIGLTLRDAYLVLPLIPAFLLGVVAVWAAVRARSS